MKISDKYLFSDPGDFEIISRALTSKKLSGTSEFVEEYEKELANFFKSKYALATSSGTAAIQTALFILDINQNDEVIIPSTCPIMIVSPVMFIRANPIFCDIKKDNFGLDIDDLENIITKKTKAIVEVPMWGYPTKVDELQEFSRVKNIPLILDLAQAHGTKINDQFLSYYGDISCFSTHDRKILATGEGGFILTNSEDYYKKAKSFIQFGNMNGIDLGLNYKLGSLQAALGINRLNHIQKQISIRKSNAEYIINNIYNPKIRELRIIDQGKPNYYSLLLDLNFNNNFEFVKFLDFNGIPSDVIRYNYKVLYKYPILSKFKRMCPNSEKLVRSITTIPIHPGIDKNSLDYIISKINEYKE